MTDLRDGYVQFGGLRMHHTWGGAGEPPLVLIHGLGSAGYLEWRHNLGPLAGGRRVFAPDLPGFGRSDKKVLPYGVPLFANAVEAYLDSLGLEQIDLAGTSLGGRVAIEVAVRRPERVRRLALVNSLGLGRPPFKPYYVVVAVPRLGETLLRGLRQGLRMLPAHRIRSVFGSGSAGAAALDDAAFAQLLDLHEAEGFHGAYAATVRSIGLTTAATDQTARLAATGLPVLLVWGARDRLFPLRLAEAAHAELPGSRLVVIEAAGHTPQAEKPDEFNRALAGFLDG